MSHHEEEQLDEYLRREYKSMGDDWVNTLLDGSLTDRLAAKAIMEQAKVMGLMLHRSYLTGLLAPPISLETQGRKRTFVAKYASYEARLRARLLPHNVYFIKDAATVRRVLDLPAAGIEPVPSDSIPKSYWWWLEQAPLDVLLLSNAWEAIHAAKARKTAYTGPELLCFTPRFLRAYLAGTDAVANPRFAPAWLEKGPALMWGRPPGYEEDLPLHRFIAVLLDRYGLAPSLFWQVRRYLFSNDDGDLGPRVPDPSPKKVDVPGLLRSVEFIPQRTPDGGTVYTLAVTVYGIDAFTTPNDWRSVWDDCIEPEQKAWRQRVAQEEFKEVRGRYPTEEEYQSLKRKMKQRAKRPFTFPVTYLPAWERMKQKGLSLEEALDDLAREGKQFDYRNARSAMKRLDELMLPTG